jgi:hypothetical protein
MGLNRMPRQRQYESAAARQAAYRERAARKGKRHVTNRDDLGDFLERLAFIRDSAGDVSRDSVRNWGSWRGAAELHAHALQIDLDDLVSRLDALIRGDSRPFDSSEFQAWRARRRSALIPTFI